MDTILLITQDHVLALAYQARLEKAGFQVAHASSGYASLDAAKACMPACLLVDAQLPGLHGLGLLKWLTDVPTLVQIPVVLLVERTLSPAVIEECLFWGARCVSYKDAEPPEDIAAVIRTAMAAKPAAAAS
jgi:DNA-binding response OmpR family regulator